MLSTSFVLLSLLALALSTPLSTTSPMLVHDSRPAPPAGFVSNGPASNDATIELRIAMASNNMAGLEKAFFDVSTPGSSNYRKFLSKEEVESFVKPSQRTVDAVNAWLSANDLKATTISPAGDWIKVNIPVSKANNMLGAEYTTFTHTASNTQAIRTLSYSVPAELKGHIASVHPATSFDFGGFSGPKVTTIHPASNSTLGKRQSCSNVSPSCLQSLYGIPTTGATQSSNQLAVAGFGSQFAQTADLSSFLSQLRPDVNSTFNLQTIDGGSNPQGVSNAGVEANLDIQYTVGIATNVPVNFVSVGTDNTDDIAGFLDIVNFLGGESTVPNTFTTSYGFNEPDVDPTTASNLCNAYMQLGARGTSIMFASGDGGVCGVQSTTGGDFVPTFPSTCPYVTSVGGTTGTPETAATFSGGGFSTIFPAPSYQSSQVSAYISSIGSTNAGLFNTSGRGFPDVSAQAVDVEIVNGGQNVLVDGTSCASPIFSSIIALLNDQLVADGKAPLGFLNPLLYANPSALNDITTGNNPGCGTNGFDAASGWDPVTGLGTPNFAALQSAVSL